MDIGFCKHQIEAIGTLTNDLGKLFPIVNGILKIRSGPHQVFAHDVDLVKMHWHTQASEAFCEYAIYNTRRLRRGALRGALSMTSK